MPREFPEDSLHPVLTVLHSEAVGDETWVVLGDGEGKVHLARIAEPLRCPTKRDSLNIPIIGPVEVSTRPSSLGNDIDAAPIKSCAFRIHGRLFEIRVGFAPKVKKWVVAC